MTFFALICLMLTVMSYLYCTKNTFHREYTFQYHDFQTQHYYLGITSEDLGTEDQRVVCITIGLLFIIFRITTYAHTPETIKQYPWLNDWRTYPLWQRLLIRFYKLIRIPKKQTLDTDKYA